MGLPRRAHRGVAAPIKTCRQRCEHLLASIDAHLPVAGQIQTHFHAAGMKTFAPVEFAVGLEVVPLETRTRAAETAVQMLPAGADRAPRGAFRKPITCGGVGGLIVVCAGA